MMPLPLSWDLFILVFFAIVMSFNFIIGKDQAMKVIIATYIAIIATQGIGSILIRLMGDSQQVFQSVGIPFDITLLSLAKIFIFALCIILFVTKSGIDITHNKDTGTILTIVYTGLFGFSLSGLIVSTVLTYAAGNGIQGSGMISPGATMPLLGNSTLLSLMTLNQDLWFTLPALLIVAVGLVHRD
jgi:hypothetical protein